MAIVGYYSMTNGQGAGYQVDEITANGDTAVNIFDLSPAELAGIDTLYVVNSSNGSFGAEYLANLGNITDAVNSGMNLMIFDRTVTNAQNILPDSTGIVAVRATSGPGATDVNVAAGAPSYFTNGGVIDDSTFDGGNLSNHGYVQLSSIPAGGTPLLTTDDPAEVVAFSYPVGAGNVFYSTIPLDFYSNSNNPAITPGDVNTIFSQTTDILCFASGTHIQTPNGARRIDDLRSGDRVLTHDGTPKTVRWIQSSTVNQAKLDANPKLRPIRITAGALGDGLPTADLVVSRQHRMLVSSKIAERMFGCRDVLVSAIKLTELPGIFIDETCDTVTYFHMLFDNHEIVVAEGAPSESLYTGPEALKALPRAALTELFELFPELAKWPEAPNAAAPIPSGRLQKKLVARHLKNSRHVINGS